MKAFSDWHFRQLEAWCSSYKYLTYAQRHVYVCMFACMHACMDALMQKYVSYIQLKTISTTHIFPSSQFIPWPHPAHKHQDIVNKSDVHVTVHHDKFLIIKPTRCTNFSNLYLKWNSTCFGQFLCPSSRVFHCTHSNSICPTGLLTACEQEQIAPAHKLSANL